jgi:general secretion pathway protein L
VELLFQTSLGIDIGNHFVRLTYLKASFRGVRLAAHIDFPVKEERPLEERVEQIGGAIREFLRENKISPAAVFLGMPRNAAILRYVQLPLSVKENLRESLGYEMEKYVPLPVDEVYFDYQIVVEDKDSGKLKLLLVASRKTSVDAYLSLATHIGVGISGIEISSTATANYFASLDGADGSATCAIVSLRDDHLEIDGLKGGFLDYSRWVDRAEWGSDPDGFIARELERGKEDLGSDQGRLCTVFCGFDEQPEFVDNFRSDDRLDICHVDLSRRGLPSPAMIPAYGLALKGIRKPQTDINLAPKERRKRPNRAGQYTMIVLSGLLILLALAWGGGSILSQQLYLRGLNAEIDRLSVEVMNIEQTRTKCESMEARIDYLSRLFGTGAPILDVLRELSLRIPKPAWVANFTYSEREVKIDGRSEASSELISSLESSPLFGDVAFISSITRDPTGKEIFRIGLKVTQ